MFTPSAFSLRLQITGVIGWLILVYAASALGALASIGASEFYATLTQPDWAPPPSVFGPVWTALYTLMGISVWLVWRAAPFTSNAWVLGLFLIQLVFNALWSWLFFTWQLGGLALFELIVLWILILATIVGFWRISRVAAFLLVPYLAWVSFAGLLNYSLWQLNPGLL